MLIKSLITKSAPINRITNLFENLFATGDDEGVIKVSLVIQQVGRISY